MELTVQGRDVERGGLVVRQTGRPEASADVDAGAAVAVGFGLAQDLAGDRGDLALAEEEEAAGSWRTGLPSVHSK